MGLGTGDDQMLLRVIASLPSARTPAELYEAIREGQILLAPGDCRDFLLVARWAGKELAK